MTKSLPITKQMVWMSYKKVKANKGSAGVDGVSLKQFERDLSNNLYKVWNRLASGSYFPPAVKEVEIPKKDGGKRLLGIPTVSDRVAQMVVKDCLEPRLEKEFLEHSYGYRPLRNAHQALAAVRKNTKRYDWVIDLDIKGFFDNIDHSLLMRALEKHVDEKWIIMYVERWLKMPVQKVSGELVEKDGKGTPQGGVISPLLANLFLHYVFDKWLVLHAPSVRFVRYADDAIIHCKSLAQAEKVLSMLQQRMQVCKLQLH
ncbi:MAG: group II intron reverse transcriptase/maturase [Carboxylicivirga sp.]|jgi:group II intron reverse transcriptase/maturase|nr:group II intron reverse transcriptase/maturase [Carboxylicivirga sp.]